MALDANEYVRVWLSRGPIRGPLKNDIGLRLRVQANSEVEDFMRSLSNKRVISADAIAPDWVSQDLTASKALDTYIIERNLSGKDYTMEAIGQQLLIGGGKQVRLADGSIGLSGDKINISFLKLVGISNEGGVEFGVSGIFSAEYVNKVRTAINPAIAQFLKDYLVPVSYTFSVFSRDNTK